MELVTKKGAAQSLPKGFKQTEVGLIPEDWSFEILSELCSKITDGTHDTPKPISKGVPFLTAIHVKENKIHYKDCYFLSEEVHNEIYRRCNPEMNDVLMVNIGAGVGTTALVKVDYEFSLKNVALLKSSNKIDGSYLNNTLISRKRRILKDFIAGGAQPFLSLGQISRIQIPTPPTLKEQQAIATALSDVDALISSLDALITKKKAIKQGAMQQLLTPPHKDGKRLPGFSGEWGSYTIEEVADCLDNLRIPLNGEVRAKMNGDIPYCGANGIVDYVNDYVLDDDVILMAEDGGYFDEYKTRPIAYRINGKCWVNNHAHILKAKKQFDQGFLFYSLVHKNILDYINGGTRAKLNKSEMNKIENWFPNSKDEQTAISEILSDMDIELEQLQSKTAKYQQVKQGMMQELLTGKTRLV
ncbi:restriction endonuclease subunit S [Postechiella marina]|uniref:Restriction endonuclease subunit S n=1 Tax=Postechiella marina TaxID=943941 RepID=A0ABP8BZ84_9FLAO